MFTNEMIRENGTVKILVKDLGNIVEAIIDEEDLSKVEACATPIGKDITWKVNDIGNAVIAKGNSKEGGKYSYVLHRVILDLPTGVAQCSFKNKSFLDCRKSNLTYVIKNYA